ncbi:MAG: hypothetical protein C0523_01035 [Cytophaga sp.]|nr:hypothetical protein [Cytophaga sp.]
MIKRIVYITLLLSMNLVSSQAQTTNHTAYSLFITSFARYASWPQTGDNFKITVLGKSKVYDELVKMTASKNVNGHPYKIEQMDDIGQQLGDSQIVYLSDNKSSSLDEILRATHGKPVMIVTEREGLAKKGAGLSFLVIDNKLRFDINNTELEKRNIKVSANLVTIANSSL